MVLCGGGRKLCDRDVASALVKLALQGKAMIFNDLEFQAIKSEVGKFIDPIRPPQNIRSEIDVIFNIKDDSVDFCELRSMWGGDYIPKCEFPFAKVTYFRNIDSWIIYWMDDEEKWHPYATIDFLLADALNEIQVDPDHCFHEHC